jgi:hypothetical protein
VRLPMSFLLLARRVSLLALTARTLRALLMTSALALGPLYFRPAIADPTPAPTFANYGFASELGSGVYSIDGRTVQIYQIPLKFSFRQASPQGATPGLNLVVPLTLGFFNFQTQDVAQLKVPNQIGEIRLPGRRPVLRLAPRNRRSVLSRQQRGERLVRVHP